jgi:hypothetical protein
MAPVLVILAPFQPQRYKACAMPAALAAWLRRFHCIIVQISSDHCFNEKHKKCELLMLPRSYVLTLLVTVNRVVVTLMMEAVCVSVATVAFRKSTRP